MDEKDELFNLVDLRTFAETGRAHWIDGTNDMWVQQYPFDSWDHPLWGVTTIGTEEANKLKSSFDNGVRGQRIHSDFEHGLDKAKGNKASGEIKELKVIEEPRGNFKAPGLWARVSFSDTAKQEIDDGEWNYWSASHYDTWTHPQTSEQHEMVYNGGGLTNQPWVKGMIPLNFSEVAVDDELKNRAVNKAKHMLSKKDHNEQMQMMDVALGDPMFDSAPVVEVVKPVVDKPVIDEGGDNDVELEKQLREALGLDADADILATVKGIHEEVLPMREALKGFNEKKAFAEQYPKEFERLERLEKESQEASARKFAESFAETRLKKMDGDKSEATTLGFSGLVVQKIQDLAKSFSEKTADLESVKDLLDAIQENGIVDYGTKGSSREDEALLFDEETAASGSMQNVRKQFAELVTKAMHEDELDVNSAIKLVADKNPALAAAYHGAGMDR